MNINWPIFIEHHINHFHSFTSMINHLNFNGFLEQCSVSSGHLWMSRAPVTSTYTSDSQVYRWQWRVLMTAPCKYDSGVYQSQCRVPVKFGMYLWLQNVSATVAPISDSDIHQKLWDVLLLAACTNKSGVYQWQWRVLVTAAYASDCGVY